MNTTLVISFFVMKSSAWEHFYCNRWDLTYLRKLLSKYKHDRLFLIPIKLQINSIILLLCIYRILPLEICHLIRDFTPNHMDHFRPQKYILKGDFLLPDGSLRILSDTIQLDRKFLHCMNKHNLCNLAPGDVVQLKKYLKVGRVGSFGKPHYGYYPYIIIDVNDDYNTVSIIENPEDSLSRIIPEKRICYHVYI